MLQEEKPRISGRAASVQPNAESFLDISRLRLGELSLRYNDPNLIVLAPSCRIRVVPFESQVGPDSRLINTVPKLTRPGASGSASDRRHAIAEFARHHPTDPVDVIIADFMSEFNMATAAGRRADQATASDSPALPAYDLSFSEAVEPALEDLARHGIKLAVNAGVADTKGLYDVVMQMIQAKGLDLKVSSGSSRLYTPILSKTAV